MIYLNNIETKSNDFNYVKKILGKFVKFNNMNIQKE
jgi:hypothetical protein